MKHGKPLLEVLEEAGMLDDPFEIVGVTPPTKTNYSLAANEQPTMTLNLDYTYEPIPRPCHGCCHYYGRIDGGNRLNCGMHPLEPPCDPCPDHEWVSLETPRTSRTIPDHEITRVHPWDAAPVLDRWHTLRQFLQTLQEMGL
jgi:hypothetical protein